MWSGVRKLGWPTSSRTVPGLVMAMLEISRMPEWDISAGAALRRGRGLRMRLGYSRGQHGLPAQLNSQPDRPGGVQDEAREEAYDDEGDERDQRPQPEEQE